MVEVKNLKFRYDNSQPLVLNDVSFTIEKGEWISIIGHNGSGKSTLAKLLTGLIDYHVGEINIDGIKMEEKNKPELRKKIGIMFQNPDNQFVGYNVKYDIAFGLENHNIKREEMLELIDKYANLTGMENYLEREPNTLSGGQKQRVALAGILALNSDIIILDEATSMPQKKNPDIAELVRGKTGRVYGDLITLLTMLKGLPLAYNKDMQEDKEAIFDSVDTLKQCLSIFTPMLKTIKVNKDNMRRAAAKGFINATDLADYLVKKGMAFRDAYKISGTIVAYCIENNNVLEDLPLDVYKKYSSLFDKDLYDYINLETCTFKRTSLGASGIESVEAQIKDLRS